MKLGCAVLALGFGLLAASVGRAEDKDLPVAPPPTPVVIPVAPPPLNGGDCGAACCGRNRGSCLQQLLRWCTYRALPVPPCCKHCPFCCRAGCYCHPPPYAYFLGDHCHEGRYYGSPCGACSGCGGCGRYSSVVPGPVPGVIPPPNVPLTGVLPPSPVPLPQQGRPQAVLPRPAPL